MGRGWFPVGAPAQGFSELCSDIPGPSLAWISPTAAFFHFELGDLEKVP